MSERVMAQMNACGRMVVCGTMAAYNDKNGPGANIKGTYRSKCTTPWCLPTPGFMTVRIFVQHADHKITQKTHVGQKVRKNCVVNKAFTKCESVKKIKCKKLCITDTPFHEFCIISGTLPYHHILMKTLTVRGFTMWQYMDRRAEGENYIAQLIREVQYN